MLEQNLTKTMLEFQELMTVFQVLMIAMMIYMITIDFSCSTGMEA